VLSCQQYNSAKSSLIEPALASATPPAKPDVPNVTASEDLKQALLEALADERRARATYKAGIDKFDNPRPFSNVVKAEARHESFLLELFAKYGFEVPENQFSGKSMDVLSTVAENCANAVDGEKANIAMYDRLLTTVSESDVKERFLYLRSASKDNHLPAFERCSQGGRGPRS
jgi:rubrerythrin